MAKKALNKMESLGKHVTDSTKDLFSERANWVQTWITAKALPFISLLTLTLSYYQLGSGNFVIPQLWSLIIAVTLLLIVIMRTIPHISQLQWQNIFGNYQISLGFLGMLLLLGNSNAEHSLSYWGILLAAFWGIGFIYPKKWLMPGEFAAVALMSSGVVIESNTPLTSWLFVLIMVSPVMLYLQWKHQLLKPVLFLAALLVGVLISSEIRGLQVILAILVALVLLWVDIYTIGQLNQKDASSFIQGVGVAVISGLLYLIFVVLMGFPKDSALTWWSMFGLFISIAIFLYYTNGSKLFMLLILWITHWSLIILTISWAEWLNPILSGDLYGFPVAAIMCSLLLQYIAFTFNNNRMLVWGRIYLMLVALSILIIDPFYEDMTIYFLMFVLTVFIFVIWVARTKNLAKGLPWWKGVINPRHIVAIRSIIRKGGNFIGSIPFIGATASAIIQAVQILTKLKRDGQNIHSGDLLLVIWVIFLAILIPIYIDKFILSDDIIKVLALGDGNTINTVTETAQHTIKKAKNIILAQSSYLIAGLLFGIVALNERQPLYNLMSMVSFLLAPIIIIGGDYLETAFFWLISLVAAIGILSVRELNK